MQFPKIKSVTAKEKYMLYIIFSDATEGEYDVSSLAGKGVFKSGTLMITFLRFILILIQAQLHGQEN